MIKEFKKFISRGNVLDLAVGVIIGGAFSKIVASVVDDLLMPLIGSLLGGFDFTSLSVKIGDAVIKYGSFIQNVFNFLFIALALFLIIKFINKLQKPKQDEKETKAPVVKPDDVLLLEEIRDLLKKQNKK